MTEIETELATAGIICRFSKAVLLLLICTFGWLDPAFGSSALDKAYISKVKPSKGILIHLHGCDGLHVKGWIKEWIKHFEKSGYKVFAPDSFAEKRPPAQCGANYSRKGEVFRIRSRQFSDALAYIRNKYPNQKVFVWGYSEGGQLLQKLSIGTDEISGALVTGHSCGSGRPARVYLSGRTPLLVLNGSEANDPFLKLELKYKGAYSIRSLCEKTLGSQKWKWISFDDYGHVLPIWDRKVREAVNSIIPIKLGFSRTTSSPRDVDASRYKIRKKARRALEKTYRGKAKPKAFAIGPNGSWSYSFGASSAVDAVTMALFWCNQYSRKVRRSNNCAVYDINGLLLGSRPPSTTAKIVQQRLKDQNVYEGEIDGKWGPGSAKALAVYRSIRGLAASNSVDLAALRSLGLVD